LYQFYASRQTSHVFEKTFWKSIATWSTIVMRPQKRRRNRHAVPQHDVVPRNTFQRVEDEPSTHRTLQTGNLHQSNDSSGGNDPTSFLWSHDYRWPGGNGFSKSFFKNVWCLTASIKLIQRKLWRTHIKRSQQRRRNTSSKASISTASTPKKAKSSKRPNKPSETEPHLLTPDFP
jgi:hypothetical protein